MEKRLRLEGIWVWMRVGVEGVAGWGGGGGILGEGCEVEG